MSNTSVIKPCPFGDPTCPCQDGDACHYVDMPGSKAWPPPTMTLGLCAACGGRTEEAVKWIGGKPYHPGCEPPMTLIDALAVLACTEALGKRDHSELKRRARAVVDQHAERWLS